jgi:3-oxoacyl-[acyl-carrier-protein] synthase-1
VKPRAYVYATGARSAAGTNTLEIATMLRAGVPVIGGSPLEGDDPKVGLAMGLERTLAPTLFGPERAAALLRLALLELTRSCRAAPRGVEPRELSLRVALALPEVEPGAGRSASAQRPLVAELGRLAENLLGASDVRYSPPNGPGGGAGAATVLDDALTALERREVDAVVFGGCHTDYDPERVRTLQASGRLFSNENANAPLPGEGAAVVLLGRSDLENKTGLEKRGAVFAVSSTRSELTPWNDRSVLADDALARCITEACRPLPAELGVGFALSDVTTEIFRVRELYHAITRATERFVEPFAVDAPAQRIGALGAAALPLALAVGADMFHRGYAPTPFGLLLAGNDDGERAAVLVGSA